MPPRPQPHPLALFSLKPLNERARQVISHQSNEHLVSYLGNGELGLNIGHTSSASEDDATLATLGRNGDVIVEGASIAKIQCSFEIDNGTKVVMFYDRSHSQTSAVFGDTATPFQYGFPRKVVVQKGLNTLIGLGGVARNLVQFTLHWHVSPDETQQRVAEREKGALEKNPRFARTVDDSDTTLTTRMGTRIHTPVHGQLQMRYVQGAQLGKGAYGKVFRGVNVDSGQLMAIKKIERGKLNDEEWAKLQREVRLLRNISHPHIVDYLYSCGWESTMAEICMGLKDGSLEKLVLEPPLRIEDVAQTVLHQMLQATDCLATHGIVHRDIKPENILYVFRQSKYHFCLADFGLSNREDLATTFSGTPIYMAPEILHRAKQTHKADIWSLFVTMLWTLDIKGFRQASASAQNLPQVQTEISSRIPTLRVIQDMAREDPDERASAAQMLVKCFDGRGLVTPRNQVPPLGYPTIPDIAMPESKRSRGTKNEKSAVTGRFRIEKPLKAKQPRGRFQVQDRGDAQF